MDHEQTIDTDTIDTGTLEHDETVEIADPAEIVDELLIEEISIDGMCGVY